MRRFLFFALPLLVLTMGLFRFAQELMGWTPDPAALAPAGAPELPAWVTLCTWILEAVGLAALFLLVHARGGSRWTAGLLTGWIAWVFRGPLLVVAVAGLGGLPPGPWWSLAFSWWILYTLCGLVLAGVAAAAALPP
ncbi:MAG TPA: hypothetical protein VLT87_21075 [Thermoanaerobaculia bacterium]|nr:hypothetical protein [Thermoanaerobaculia bacterium]